MSQTTESFPPRKPETDPALLDLPPVEAPSAGFIVQLFVIPAVVVAVVIVVWLLFGKLAGGERDALTYVETLKSPSASWRAAFELASLIQNDPKLGGDPRLLGELTELLDDDLKHDTDPKLKQYLALTLGAFQTLDARTATGRPVDPLAVLARALDARQPPEVRMGAAFSLAKHAARAEGTLDDPAALQALDAAAHSDEPELRKVAAFALGFCGGETTVAQLRALTDDEDRDVRYNAAVALARRGDLAARPILREMLSSTALGQALILPSPSEKQNKIEFLELQALQALQTAAGRGQLDLIAALRPEITGLGNSGLVAVRNDATALLKSLPAAR